MVELDLNSRDALGQGIMSVEKVADASEPMKQLTAYIVDKVIKRKGVEINEDTPIGVFRPRRFFCHDRDFHGATARCRTQDSGKQGEAKDMDTVRLMFAMAEKFGKPAKADCKGQRLDCRG